MVVALSLLVGCSKPGAFGSKLSGKITADDKPIPAGMITFEPDSKAGNSGPGTYAVIVNGQYETADSRGIIGGPYIISVEATDGVRQVLPGEGLEVEGKPLFPSYKEKMNLSKDGGTKDINVPASHVNAKP